MGQYCADSGIGGGERRLMAALLADGVEAYIGRSLSQRLGEGNHLQHINDELALLILARDRSIFANLVDC